MKAAGIGPRDLPFQRGRHQYIAREQQQLLVSNGFAAGKAAQAAVLRHVFFQGLQIEPAAIVKAPLDVTHRQDLGAVPRQRVSRDRADVAEALHHRRAFGQIEPDGISGAVYGQFPPLVRAVRPPAGEWQSFDIFFTSPRFADGKLTAPAYVTIVLNGVLIQNHQALLGPTRHRELATYDNQATRGPVMLQYHGSDVRFRNIWIRPLETK